jgi:hypothetical protein
MAIAMKTPPFIACVLGLERLERLEPLERFVHPER